MEVASHPSRAPFTHPLCASAALHGFMLLALLVASVWKPHLPKTETFIPLEIVEFPRAAAKTARAPTPAKRHPDRPANLPTPAREITDRISQAKAAPERVSGNTAQDRPTDSPASDLSATADLATVTRMPALLSDVRIPFPDEARRQGVQGAVVFDLVIDEQGNVRQVKLVEGPGYGLNEAAQSAVGGLKFRPAFVQDRPVAVKIRYAYRFVLSR